MNEGADQGRKLAVLLHADIVGSTALVQINEVVAHRRMQDAFARFSETIRDHGGNILEIRGDAMVGEFQKASDAVSASLAFLETNNANNRSLEDGIVPRVRVGIAMGEVLIADGTVNEIGSTGTETVCVEIPGVPGANVQ